MKTETKFGKPFKSSLSELKMWAKTQLKYPDDSQCIVRDARDFSLVNGLVHRFRDTSNDNSVHQLPVTLFPSPLPRRLYQECLELQPIISRLMLKIATDYEFLHASLDEVARVDEFTRNLLEIDTIILKEGQSQSTMSCISRSDYMMHSDSNVPKFPQLRQVEVNAISSAACGHSLNAEMLHEYILRKYGIRIPNGMRIPKNDSLQCVAQGIIDAFDIYGKADAYVLMIVEDRSINFADQFAAELTVSKTRPDVRFIRRSFSSLSNTCSLGPNKELLLDKSKEIALVYFRYCYDPSHYNFYGAWNLRLLLERSRAVKCPSINFHLSGAKKFQHVLNNRRQLERYLNATEAERLALTFCKIWSVDDLIESSGLELSENLVLKPQREGGGHNVYGKDIKPFIERIVDNEERLQYILMEYIDSPRERNYLLQYDDIQSNEHNRLDHFDELVSELGIFGSILATHKCEIKSNKYAGYLLRSKKYGIHEGGIAFGYGGISSVILVDDLQEDSDHPIFYND